MLLSELVDCKLQCQSRNILHASPVLSDCSATDAVTKLEADAPEVRVVLSEPVDYETFAKGLRDTKLFISPLGCALSQHRPSFCLPAQPCFP